METLHQIFTTVIAALMFFILIVKFASATVNNGDQNRFKSNKVEETSTKRKSQKKVRFAVDHDEFVINKAIAEPLETESGVLDQNRSEIESVERKLVEENVGRYDQDEKMCVETVTGIPCTEHVHLSQKGPVCPGNLNKENQLEEDEKMCLEKEGLISDKDDSSDDDDWEGVERSELEKLFAVAADYGKLDDNLRNVDKDVEMELYGLYKVATEGPCHEGQPMALKVSARAKWNAWQKLGNMNPDVAMEQYITLLSEKVPGWSLGNPDYVDKN